MLFGTRGVTKKTELHNLILNGVSLHYVTDYKYLGVKLDNTLSFEKHGSEIIKMDAHTIYILSKLRAYLSPRQALQLYKTKVLSYLDYGDIFYMSTNTHWLNKIQRLQHRAIRICLKLPPRSSVVELNLEAKMPFLEYRRKCHLRNFMYKRISLPNYLAQPSRPTRLQEAPVAKTLMPNCNAARKSVFVWGHPNGMHWEQMCVRFSRILILNNYVQKAWMPSMMFML